MPAKSHPDNGHVATRGGASDVHPTIGTEGKTGDVLVAANRVGKRFCRDLKKSLWYGLQDCLHELNPFAPKSDGLVSSRILRPAEFWAIQDISFELRRGECLGLIGKNGAGKTTLLKILNGLIKPDEGRVTIKGRVGAIIALGAGFNPILTGRENIYVNASVLGISHDEVNEKLDDIIDFADLRHAIDAPVQSYSSGMTVRLGFAVATALQPDILILDEVLAVGDTAFRTKCFNRISTLLDRCAVIFVSHSEEQLLRICQNGLLLEAGRVTQSAPIQTCLSSYRNSSGNTGPKVEGLDYADNAFELLNCDVSNALHHSGDDLAIQLRYNSEIDCELAIHVLSFINEEGRGAAAVDLLGFHGKISQGANEVKFTIKALCLKPGNYGLTLEIVGKKNARTLARLQLSPIIKIEGSITHWCDYTPRVTA